MSPAFLCPFLPSMSPSFPLLSNAPPSRRTVLVSDPALMRTGLADPVASGRTDLLLLRKRDSIIKGRECPALGIIGTSGDVWRQQRRFTLRTLRDLGFGRNTMEPIMQEELDELLQLFTRRQGEKVDVGVSVN
ncbi:Cytochrome P450 2J6 [Chionoecetes opilio]|uniref:Cytochrome P450 2J6 n=1 Tax=Chionoecetes opilio TaxID=41210 RepID=A0A8J5CXD6_CHIOP|nr:Cytochrome P450 2J6 [Chionoecetes opilio]